MVIPYVLIHFGKPFPETLGAIFAGTALGYIALKSRSIFVPFLIHSSVAFSMDIICTIQKLYN